jgi:hypothetical protein
MRYILSISILILLYACTNTQANHAIQPAVSLQVDDTPGSCPYLTKDAKGNIAISWIKMINDSVTAFCYAISADGGNTFGKTMIVPGTDSIQPHSENLPKIIFKLSGEIIALWGVANPNANNKYSGLVSYSQSFDNGATWSHPKPLVSDTAGYDQRYYDVALLPNGEAAIIWLDNRTISDKEGSSLYYATTNGRDGFTGERRITEGCCQCCRTALFIDSKAGIHVLYRGIIKDSIRDMLHSVSSDGGQTFATPQLISNDNWVIKGCPHTGPAMTENKEGLHFSWFTGAKNKGCFYTQSNDNGNTFTGHERISEMGSHPQITTLTDGRILTVWDESVEVNNTYNKRIGLQLRSPKGADEYQGYITGDTSMATYPVIESINDQGFIVAYTIKKQKKDHVVYQHINMKK